MQVSKKFVASIAGATALCAVGIGVASHHAASAQPAPLASASTVKDMPKAENMGMYPEMQKALTDLQDAQSALSTARKDFHGHRAKALDLTNQAIGEVQAGITAG